MTLNLTRIILLILIFWGQVTFSQDLLPKKADTLKNSFSLREIQFLGLGRNGNREVTYDAANKHYIIQEIIIGSLNHAPQSLSVDEYERLMNAELKRKNWRLFAHSAAEASGNTIAIRPRGEAELTFMGRVHKNENPLFNKDQRVQTNFDFKQRIQLDLIGNVGTKLKINMNYNTEAQFDFENQVKLEYTGGEDEIIKKIEAGHVSFPLSTSLINGSPSLFGVKTQLQFGRLSMTNVFAQHKSQSTEVLITKGGRENEFRLSADNYEASKHYFLAHYFRENYNRNLSRPPVLTTGINITKIEVWITNKSGATQDSRDVVALLDLGEHQPYNTSLVKGGPGFSPLPSAFHSAAFPRMSNDLLLKLPTDARLTNSNAIMSFFQASGGTANFSRLTYARKLADREYKVHPQLGYISLNNALNADEVLAVAFRYTFNGMEYQVGEFSADLSFEPASPKVLFVKLLKNESIRTDLPTWDLMMKNVYSIGGYQLSSQHFKLDIFRIDEKTGTELAYIPEGEKLDVESKTPLKNKSWLQVTRLDRLNQQQENKPDGVFDFEAPETPFGSSSSMPANGSSNSSAFSPSSSFGNSLPNSSSGTPGESPGSDASLAAFGMNANFGYVTIDPLHGRIIFPVLEPFGRDLASQFYPAEQNLIDKYTFQALYDSTKVMAQQQLMRQNRFILKGTYQSEVSSEFFLNAINVPKGSVKVFSGNLPLQEGLDFTVDYLAGRVKILNAALLNAPQPIRIITENHDVFGLQQKTLFGMRMDYRLHHKLNLGATLMKLTEKPLTAKVNIGEEPISNTMWGLDLNYTSPSRFLTRLVDRIPFIATKEASSLTFSGEFAQLIPGHPKVLHSADAERGTSYLDDFEASRSVLDLKSASAWSLSGTPQLFPESQLIDNLAYGFNRATLAFYNIDPGFYDGQLRSNRTELSRHEVRQVLEQEVFPFKEISTGQLPGLPTFDLAFYPATRGPYNYATTGFNQDGSLRQPRSRWGGIIRRLETNDFEALNMEYIELWVMDPFLSRPGGTGGDLYFNLGNLSEDILKDGRKSLENGLSAGAPAAPYDETNWGRVPKLQPVTQAFDNNPNTRKVQDVGLDGLSNEDERAKFADPLRQIMGQLLPVVAAQLENDPSSDDFAYFRGNAFDEEASGILKRYARFNGTEGNYTSLPDAEDVNRDHNMSQADEYFQYKISMRPADLVVGKKYVSDKVTSQVRLPDGQLAAVTWYQLRIPLAEYDQRIGGIQDFKSIRFLRLFMTGFADTTILRFAKMQLVSGEWRQYKAVNKAAADHSSLVVATINIEENGKRSPIPYVLPRGIERERDFNNLRGETRQNEQSLSLTVKNLRDGDGRSAFKTGFNDFRSYKRLELYVHAEAEGNSVLNDGDLQAFIRIGTDDQDNYYEYAQPLVVTVAGTSNPDAIWPEQNKMDIKLELFQQAKLARNSARTANGQMWPANIPYTHSDGVGTITIKGQPDLGKVRVYMLGVKNAWRNPGSPGSDDGLDKHAQLWFNELRLTEFDERRGWAATATMNARLADFAELNISGSKSTVGFGSLEHSVNERSREDQVFFDLSSSLELGKFFPHQSGIRIPVYVSYSNQVSTPFYDPLMPDIELRKTLNGATREERKAILNDAQDFSTRNSINFTNVRKERTDQGQKPRLWDVENLSASYAYAHHQQRDFVHAESIQRNYRGSLAYNYSAQPVMISPFEKLIRSNTLALLRDINFSLLPASLNFNIALDRYYAENTLRANSPANGIPIHTTFNKNFLVTRVYGISWNLSRSMTLDLDATNYSIIDEPDGRINGSKRDTVWQNLLRLGRTTDYNHNLNITYQLPFHQLPGMNWLNVATRYGANFNWQTEAMATWRDPQLNLGNTIQNSRTIQLNPTLNLNSLYQQFGLLRRNNKALNSGAKGLLLDMLTGIKTINGAYTQTKGIFLPGYLPGTHLFGLDQVSGAPGLAFVFGSQRDISQLAINGGWITTDSLQSQLYINTFREDYSITTALEPIRDLRITLTANKNQTLNYASNFRYSPASGTFDQLSPGTTGDYSVTFISLRTAFTDAKSALVSKVYQAMLNNRMVVSRRLGAQNPNSRGLDGGFADGYQKNAQDVVITAFMTAYTGRDARSSSLNSMPKIPLPNWRVNYGGLGRMPFLMAHFKSIDLRHGYRSVYSINGFNSLLKYAEQDGQVSSRDLSGNFLPYYQYSQVSIAEQFSPLVGIDTRLKNNLTLNFEYAKTRLLGLSLANSQLAQFAEDNLVFGLGYRTTKFRFPLGMFKQVKMNNNMDFKVDVAVRDHQTVIYRADVPVAEVSAGAKNITFRPSVDYILNQRFNVKVFYDSNLTQPYTSQTFNTAYSNFGFSLRVTLD
ncbi:cell surface protein SprA [Pedobacter immunditicola]|uniref:T9SS outer membrane translocon Sov/SprA n=1 Tax=Pedobacter immunditicola TaxID=3133440 RepID=UPI0030AE5302